MSMYRRMRGLSFLSFALVVAVVQGVPLTFASPAAAKQPTGDFAGFIQCPRFAPPTEMCIHTSIVGGEITIGNMKMVITRPILLQGGYYESKEELVFAGALNGETIPRVHQPVSGGLLGILAPESLPKSLRDILQTYISKGATHVDATIELAASPKSIVINTSNLINREGVGLLLPLKVHLESPFLGSQCYIGSSSNPILFHLTTGTTSPPAPNKPIHGILGDLRFKDEFELIEIPGDLMVDNAFSAPGASGCGAVNSPLIASAIDARLRLPSAPGYNTIVEYNTIEVATVDMVVASER